MVGSLSLRDPTANWVQASRYEDVVNSNDRSKAGIAESEAMAGAGETAIHDRGKSSVASCCRGRVEVSTNNDGKAGW